MNFWAPRRDGGLGFADTVIASFPPALPPPEPLKQYLRWLESVDAVRTSPEGVWALADPDAPDWSMQVGRVVKDFAIAYLGVNDPALHQRMAAFFRTGGDGSYAALWLGDDGGIKFVHQGSGSGSSFVCTLTDDPVDFLRLIAIGYDELCWPQDFDKTPEEIHARNALRDGDPTPFAPRRRLRNWVETNFGVRVPSKASDILSTVADIFQDGSDDPFWRWIRAAQDRHGYR